MKIYRPECDRDAPYAKLGLEFTQALVGGAFSKAYSMLSAVAQASSTPEQLKAKYEEMMAMIADADNVIGVHVETTLESWPAAEANDVGWVYVAITLPRDSEGVAVVVTREASELAIRCIEWGRP